jgi:hypothetical protein
MSFGFFPMPALPLRIAPRFTLAISRATVFENVLADRHHVALPLVVEVEPPRFASLPDLQFVWNPAFSSDAGAAVVFNSNTGWPAERRLIQKCACPDGNLFHRTIRL